MNRKNTKIIEVPRALKHVYRVHDDYRTPAYLVECLDPFVGRFLAAKKKSGADFTVYCPFDSAESEYVRYFKKKGAVVIYGDIRAGHDFYREPVPKCDLVASNPPFSNKKAMFEKLFRAGRPFAMLMNLTAIQYQEIGNLFYEQGLQGDEVQFIIPDKKVSFNGKTSAFCSGYFTWKFTDKTHFVHLEHNNSGRHFVPAAGEAE